MMIDENPLRIMCRRIKSDSKNCLMHQSAKTNDSSFSKMLPGFSNVVLSVHSLFGEAKLKSTMNKNREKTIQSRIFSSKDRNRSSGMHSRGRLANISKIFYVSGRIPASQLILIPTLVVSALGTLEEMCKTSKI